VGRDASPPRHWSNARNGLTMVRAYMAAGASIDSIPEGTQRFVIVTFGRTGSELLTSLLSSHSRIICDGEVLSKKRMNPDRLLAGRAARSLHHGRSAYGLKVKPKDILEVQEFPDAEEWIRLLSKRGWLVIRLRRRDRMQQAISAIRGSWMQWHFRASEVPPPFSPVAIDPYLVIANMCTIAYYERQIDDLMRGVEHLSLFYEDDLQEPANQAVTVDRICELLGLPPQPTFSDLVRIHPSGTRQMVENYEEIAAVVRRNEFADFLEEPQSVMHAPTSPGAPRDEP
jgi:LPS sulfotransferase NodH